LDLPEETSKLAPEETVIIIEKWARKGIFLKNRQKKQESVRSPKTKMKFGASLGKARLIL